MLTTCVFFCSRDSLTRFSTVDFFYFAVSVKLNSMIDSSPLPDASLVAPSPSDRTLSHL
jgi:hypothetical protein